MFLGVDVKHAAAAVTENKQQNVLYAFNNWDGLCVCVTYHVGDEEGMITDQHKL